MFVACERTVISPLVSEPLNCTYCTLQRFYFKTFKETRKVIIVVNLYCSVERKSPLFDEKSVKNEGLQHLLETGWCVRKSFDSVGSLEPLGTYLIKFIQ